MDSSLLTETGALSQEHSRLADEFSKIHAPGAVFVAAHIVDFSARFYATSKSMFLYRAVRNQWKQEQVEVNARVLKSLETTNSIVQVSENGAILAQNGCLHLESGKQVPVDPASVLVADSLLVNDLLIPLKGNMVPYQHHCSIKLVCQSG